METKDLAKRQTGDIGESMPAPPPRITPETIQETTQAIALLQGMVKDLLIRGVDYGRIPGTPQDSLWDPGASQIIGSFNCYPGERRILKLEDSDTKIVACVEVPIVSRTTGHIVGTGIGAASTLETKYKYRWVANPQEWGYDDTAIRTLKTKSAKDDAGNKVILYRIPNPEHSELLNTIIKMASKRAEVDGAEGLPGVASVLRVMFSPKETKSGERPEYEGPRWTHFWGEVRRLGYTDEEAHSKLKVTSMKQWLSNGHSLDEALDILRGKEAKRATPPAGAQIKPPDAWAKITEDMVPDYPHLEPIIWQLATMQPQQMYQALGASKRADMTISPWDAFLQLKAQYGTERKMEETQQAEE